jgi:hypothetical protein
MSKRTRPTAEPEPEYVIVSGREGRYYTNFGDGLAAAKRDAEQAGFHNVTVTAATEAEVAGLKYIYDITMGEDY